MQLQIINIMTEQRLKNITEKEAILNKIKTFLGEANNFLEKWEQIEKEHPSLMAYYHSEQWQEDFEASNQGEIPKSIPQGVLSEDGVYNTLIEQKDLAIRLLKLATKILEE